MNTPKPQPRSERSAAPIFISHATADDALVDELRKELEACSIPVWVDSRKLRGGDKLAAEIAQAIETARQFLVVLSPNTVNSPWVRKEIDMALEVEERRRDEGYRVIPLLLPGMSPKALEHWFQKEPVATAVALGPGGIAEALPQILADLGERLPTGHRTPEPPPTRPLEDLILTLSDPRIEREEGKRRAAANATLTFQPADPAARRIDSVRFAFTAPLGPIEADDLRWYLEEYHRWPTGTFTERAEATEKKLPQWGRDLFDAALAAGPARDPLAAWQLAAGGAERRFSVQVDGDLAEGASEEAQAAAREAATELLSLPWELLHDGHGWLFQGANAARVRRRLVNRRPQVARATTLPIRILLVSPRPDKDEKGEPIGYFDHRASARPLVEAVENLGELVRLTVLAPPTYAALDAALQQAADRREPFDVVHIDGHGRFNPRIGLGGLCFEDAKDEALLEGRTMEFIDAAQLAGLFRSHRVPLVFLDACQTAKTELNPTASVAARLLEEGVASVVAMSHSVLVETARRFVQAFYAELARGARVGRAMLAGQRALYDDTWRGKIMGAGDLRLQDWFVPVIYQEEQDPPLVTKTLDKVVQKLEARKRRLSLGGLPEPPPYQFQGRSRKLLALERLLHRSQWAVVRGTGGSGKTTLAAELARWLVRTGRFERAAFVSFEHCRDARAVLDELGRQLLPGNRYSVAEFRSLDEAFQPVERALEERRTIIVLDNCESVLPLSGGAGAATGRDRLAAAAAVGDEWVAILDLCRRVLGEAGSETRLVFTSRESLPPPFDWGGFECELGALDRPDAVELVSRVMALEGLVPKAGDSGADPREIVDLVEAVNRHARALVLLAREIARRGVNATTAHLRALMAALERRHPGDRENSLYASVELSLRRLPAKSRERIKVLGVCHGGVSLSILADLANLEIDEARQICIELIEVGLAEDMGGGHLRLDPGLPPYLLGELPEDEADAVRSRWAEAMAQLAGVLYKEWFKDARIASHLTLLELPNLLAMLDELQDQWPPERVVELAASVERLIANLGKPQALAAAVRVREKAAKKLGEWSHARFISESAAIDRLLDRGELPAAHEAARQVLQRGLAAGESAFPGAAYDIAVAHFDLGRVLEMGGAAEDALAPLEEAQRRFQKLADAGNESAARMAAVAITETGDCLRALGRLEESADAYQKAIELDQAGNRFRDVAVGKGQLGAVRMLQERYDEALAAYVEARDTFERLGEPRSVATVWHQIGMVHERAGRLEAAEAAYRRSLAIEVRENNPAGQASTLGQLGNLYKKMGRLEEAVKFYRQTADLDARLQDLSKEGKTRYNLAETLIQLNRCDEARREIHRAIECDKPFGHAAEPWKTWGILENLERATGHADAAQAARENAVEAYLAYRRARGVSQSPAGELFELVAQAVQENTAREADQFLAQLADEADTAAFVKALIAKLRAVLAGDRAPALAADPELDCRDAAELQLLLEQLPSQ